jgi:lipopolysaccharide/colanic/teichoic acid biosynthesis glycosyltransferase
MNHRSSPSAQMRASSESEEFFQPTIEIYTRRIFGYDTLSWIIQAFLSLLGLILFSPLLLLIAVMIKLTSRGPVLYRGERVGRGKRIFTIYKFRTLIEGAEEKIGARLLSSEDRSIFCTRIGRFLKRSKLDELPQLFNVIRGNMRLVGPRPIRPVFLEQFQQEIPIYASRFLVPPGITGIAQLRGGYYTSPRNKLYYDRIYIKNRSLLLDLKLVLLTSVKILNRWLSMGFFVLFLFLLVSFIPPSLQPFFHLTFFGIKVSLVYLFIILVAGWVFLKKGPTQFCLYRSPLNLAVFLFVLFSLPAALFSDDPYRALQGAGYYLVTGFLVSFMIVNGLGTIPFITLMVRVIALTSVLISLLGLIQIFILNYTLASAFSSVPSGNLLEGYSRVSSILGDPQVLAVYLVLGVPLLLSEVTRSRSQNQRDFWLICTTVSFVGIFFTQSRLGLFALLVAGTMFLYRRLSHALSFFVIFLLFFMFLASLGIPRFSFPEIRQGVTRRVEEKTLILRTIPPKKWVFGVGATMNHQPVEQSDQQKGLKFDKEGAVEIKNMHLSLVLEHGITGWLIMMWLVFSTVLAMKQAHDRTKDGRLRTLLWAIISSVLGFLVSMNGINAFHNLTIQIFFWSLIGIGLAIVIRLNGQRRHNLIWRFGDAGD